jgi:hypothetical protein
VRGEGKQRSKENKKNKQTTIKNKTNKQQQKKQCQRNKQGEVVY